MKRSPKGKEREPASREQSPSFEDFKRGDAIEARYKGKERFYPGIISKDNRDGTYAIDYDDGEKESRVKHAFIKSQGKSGGGMKHSPRGGGVKNSPRASSRNNSDTEEEGMKRGDKVEARYRGGAKFYPGVIKRDNRDGTFDVDYDDGEKEKDVKKRLITKLKADKGKDSSDTEQESDDFKRGDKVEAKYRGGAKFYLGVIARDNRDGTFDVNYDDGEKVRATTDLVSALISFFYLRFPCSPAINVRARISFTRASKSLCQNTPIKTPLFTPTQATYKFWTKHVCHRYLLTIAPPRSQEKDVKKRLIKKLKSEKKDNSDTEADSSFKRGDKVEARYRGGAKFYPGVIKRDNRDDTYDIDYDDGEKEQGVKKRLIKQLKSASSDAEADDSSFKRGDKVEAKYRGGVKFYTGVIKCDNGDGTFDVDYDDGEKVRARAHLIYSRSI